MGDTRCEISRGIDGVACGAAEGEADGENQQAYGDESETAETDGDVFVSGSWRDMKRELRASDEENGKDEDVGSESFAEEGLFEFSDIGCGAEAGEFEVLVFGGVEMFPVEGVDQAGAGECSGELRQQVARE
ncbi:MAG: hypothetical protein RI897_1357 [Verrucomicrobiota bacterium]